MQQLAATLLFGSAVTAATAGKLASVFRTLFPYKAGAESGPEPAECHGERTGAPSL